MKLIEEQKPRLEQNGIDNSNINGIPNGPAKPLEEKQLPPQQQEVIFLLIF